MLVSSFRRVQTAGTFHRMSNPSSAPGVSTTVESLLKETRLFPPTAVQASELGGAFCSSMDEYHARHARSIADPEGFWGEVAQDFEWFTPWSKVLEWNCPDAKWFVGATTNICHNALDRHVLDGHGHQVGIIWEGEPKDASGTPEVKHLCYGELLDEVCRAANALKSLGVQKGDVVTLYMGMVPELAIAMLACARIGAAHSVIFGGFPAPAIVDRMLDANSRVIITCDGAWRRGAVVALKKCVDEAIELLAAQRHTVDHCVVVTRTKSAVTSTAGRDHAWHELLAAQSTECACEAMDSEDLLFLLYTSGSTGKPKGIRHTIGGYMVYTAYSAQQTFNLRAGAGHVYWCTADIGWVTGHSYIVYGPLANGATSVLYEGTPDFPAHDRWWEIVERYGVTILYTAPTAIRSHMKWGAEHAAKHDLSSLRLLGSVGEPINPEAWIWYQEHIGGGRCPIVDTWWQTETGMILITPLPGITTTKPGSATKPFPGVDVAVLNEAGEEVGPGGGGYLVLRRPWPGITRGIFGDPERFRDVYWSRFPGLYFAGDGARIDEDGDYWLLGRVDDVMNVAGHRMSTIEIESALVSHPMVAEAAVAARADALTGQAIVAFVTLRGGAEGSLAMMEELRNHVAHHISPIAKPANIVFTPELPKTRSGKIMRRLLRDVAENRPLGDTTTLADPAVVGELQERAAGENAGEE